MTTIKAKRSNRSEKNVMIMGTRAIIESIKAGKTIDKIFVQKGLKNPLITELYKLIKERELPQSSVPEEKLNKISRKNHQGAIAFVAPIDFAQIDNVIMNCYERGEDPFILILDRITDVRNFGAIARTAECAGVHALVIPLRGAAQVNSDAMKTSSGALNYISVCREHNLKDTIIRLKESGIKVIACSEKAEKNIFEEDLTGPIAIIMGSEEDGVSPAYWKLCDGSVKIPMNGKIDSLNVSVSAAVLSYEIVRQRLGS